jgi:hypothetical protein
MGEMIGNPASAPVLPNMQNLRIVPPPTADRQRRPRRRLEQ